MSKQFTSLNDMKEFANVLSNELNLLGFIELSNGVKEFSYNPYTTSSEYLGELRVVLEKIINEVSLYKFTQMKRIREAIKEIERAFS